MTPRFFCMMSDVSSRQKFCKCPHRRYRISHIGKSLFLLPPLFSRFPSVLTKPSLQPAFPLPLPFPSLGHSKHHTGREEKGGKKGIFTDAQNGRPPPPSFSLPVFYCVSTEEKNTLLSSHVIVPCSPKDKLK